jgi:hypothetical protein
MQKTVLSIIVIVAVLVIGWALWPRGGDPLPEPPPVEAPPAPPMTPAQTPQAGPMGSARQERLEPVQALPPLEDSDAFVRERIEPMDLPEPWLEQGDYVRRLAVLAENARRGTYPRRQLAFLDPRGEFKVVERDARTYVDPASYDRYDHYVEELESVEPAQLADLLETLQPLVETALQELGVDAPSGEIFQAAVTEVLAVPDLDEGQIEVVQPNVMYKYADPELESLSALKKQVLRMGPENAARLKAYVRRLAEEMDLDV